MSDLSNQSLWLISASVFVGGLVGSPHCLSMCGPIVVNFASKRSHLASYQLGRMFAYCIAGATLGAFGSSLLSDGRPAWVSGLTLTTIAILLIFNGYRAMMGKPLHFVLPTWINKWLNPFVTRLWSYVRLPQLPKIAAAGLAGFLTVFLPCGHLYGFLIGAAVTGSALKGALFMFAFWLGSAPLLSASGGLLQNLIGNRLKKNGQRWAGALLVASGLFSIFAFSNRADQFSKVATPLSNSTTSASPESPTPHSHHSH